MHPPLPTEDLDHILSHTLGVWEKIRGRKIFLTGGTGFFGIWLLESFCHANAKLSINAEITVLTRDPESFQTKAPHLICNEIKLIKGDISNFTYPEADYEFLIHAATDTSDRVDANNAANTFNAILTGTQHILKFAEAKKISRLLFTSSGAVYGKQPHEVTHIPETFPGSPALDDPHAAYGLAKRASEFLFHNHALSNECQCMIARCFAFIGPHLRLDGPYAVGNFMRDAIAGNVVNIQGDGTPRRSYLYAADLAIWLWKILTHGKCNSVYNVGSLHDLSITEVANIIANSVEPPVAVRLGAVPNMALPPSRYVPCNLHTISELKLTENFSFPEAVKKTIEWNKASKS